MDDGAALYMNKGEKKLRRGLYFISIALFAALLMSGCGKQAETETSKKEATGKQEVEIEIKDYGTIKLELDAQQAPITVDNFIMLANDGFYDGLTFHRIIKGFMMQGGDPKGDGSGGSSDTIKGEFANNGVDNTLSHTRGAISMARSKDPDSASSQFFIVHEDSLFLDKEYAAFGYVVEGMDIVDTICNNAVPTDGNGSISPNEQPVINTIRVIE